MYSKLYYPPLPFGLSPPARLGIYPFYTSHCSRDGNSALAYRHIPLFIPLDRRRNKQNSSASLYCIAWLGTHFGARPARAVQSLEQRLVVSTSKPTVVCAYPFPKMRGLTSLILPLRRLRSQRTRTPSVLLVITHLEIVSECAYTQCATVGATPILFFDIFTYA